MGLAKQKKVPKKTFTGCWTCQERRIRYDEGRPSCSQCTIRGIDCGGYSARLTWLPLESGFGSQKSSSKLQRGSDMFGGSRRLVLNAADKTLIECDVENSLAEIERIDVDACQVTLSTIVSGPFGVFSRFAALLSSTFSDPVASFVDNAVPHLSQFDSKSLGGALNVQETSNHDAVQRPAHQSPLVDHVIPVPSTPCSPFISDEQHDSAPESWDDWSELNIPVSQCCEIQHGLSIDDVSAGDPVRYPPMAVGQTHVGLFGEPHTYLLYHYRHKIVNLFCSFENPKSPWKTIHLPRALQTAAELSTGGTTSLIRQALLSSLLSTSAFYLANCFRKSPNEAQNHNRWDSVARELRFTAIALLQQAMTEEFNSGREPKYKDFLVTMLSMVTIDVMSGDTATCGVHIDGCEKLIRHFKQTKKRYSKKARALHRIFFYIRTIYESTSPRLSGEFNNRNSDFESPVSSSPSLEYSENHFYLESVGQMPPWLDTSRNLDDDMSSFELIYGIPEDLISMLNSTTRLIKILKEPNCEKSSLILSKVSKGLEAKILDWPVTEVTEQCKQLCKTDEAGEILKHQIEAFYNAIVIYFSQNVLSMSYRYLRGYVEKVLVSTEAIEAIKQMNNIVAGPLFWPIFIAATEAEDEKFKTRCKDLFEIMEGYGFDAIRGGRDIIYELWRRRTSDHIGSNWLSIVEEKKIVLMLS